MKTVKILNNRPESEMIMDILHKNGIDSLLQADDCAGTNPALLINDGISILVKDEDYEKAVEIVSNVMK